MTDPQARRSAAATISTKPVGGSRVGPAPRAGVSDEDVLASVHQFMQDLLVRRITATVVDRPGNGALRSQAW